MTGGLVISLLAMSVAACSGNKAANNTMQNAAAPPANTQSANALANNQAAPAPAPAPGTAAGGITPQEVRAMVQRDGANKTVQSLNEGGTEAAPNRLAKVMDGISRGEQAWLDIVPLIRPGTDGETGEGLYMSLGDALPLNAAGVLRAAGAHDDVGSVCDPFAFGDMSAERRAYRQRAIAAVEAVNDPALRAAKASCLTSLRRSAPAG